MRKPQAFFGRPKANEVDDKKHGREKEGANGQKEKKQEENRSMDQMDPLSGEKGAKVACRSRALARARKEAEALYQRDALRRRV